MKSPKYSGRPKKLRLIILRRVQGVSMTPSLKPGQIVIATGLFRQLKPEDVVIIAHDHIEKVKRVQKIKGKSVFIVGDNPRRSLDSRSLAGCD